MVKWEIMKVLLLLIIFAGFVGGAVYFCWWMLSPNWPHSPTSNYAALEIVQKQDVQDCWNKVQALYGSTSMSVYNDGVCAGLPLNVIR
jgi:hypothetical protein